MGETLSLAWHQDKQGKVKIVHKWFRIRARYGTSRGMTDSPTFVTHLECSMTGERYEADRLHGLSAVGRPLLVRYDLEGVRAAMTKDVLSSRPRDLWRYRELLPVRRDHNIVSLGEQETPLIPLPAIAKSLGAREILVKDEGRGSRVVNALTVRVILAALTVALISWGFYSGQLVSHVAW